MLLNTMDCIKMLHKYEILFIALIECYKYTALIDKKKCKISPNLLVLEQNIKQKQEIN